MPKTELLVLFSHHKHNVMNNIPDTVKVGSREVTVSIEAFTGDNKDLMGYYDQEKLVIAINKTLAPYQIVETFWHELIHAINDYNRFTVELAMEIASEGNPDEKAWNFEERMTESFAMMFVQVITDNNLLKIKA